MTLFAFKFVDSNLQTGFLSREKKLQSVFRQQKLSAKLLYHKTLHIFPCPPNFTFLGSLERIKLSNCLYEKEFASLRTEKRKGDLYKSLQFTRWKGRILISKGNIELLYVYGPDAVFSLLFKPNSLFLIKLKNLY